MEVNILKFDELGINEKIVRAVTEMGFEEATPIQARAIPVVMEGKILSARPRQERERLRPLAFPFWSALILKISMFRRYIVPNKRTGDSGGG